MPIFSSPSQCPYTKSLFQNKSYDLVEGLAQLHTNLHTIECLPESQIPLEDMHNEDPRPVSVCAISP